MNRIVIAGGHGKIALLLAPRLNAEGVRVQGLIRDPEQAADLMAAGAEPLVFDLEHASAPPLALLIDGADAVLFAAGAGPGSTAERKYTVDRDGSVLLADAAQTAGVRRFVQISAMGIGSPVADGADPVWKAYIDAKTQAEDDLKPRDLDWTILRPGGLLDDPGLGTVTLAEQVTRGTVPRADVASVLAGLLLEGAAVRRTLELVSGPTPIPDAVLAWKA